MTSLLALLLFAPVPVLHALGHLGTCTQNDVDPFLTGAILAIPLGAASAGSVAWSTRHMRVRGRPSGHVVRALLGLCLVAMALLDLVGNLALLRDTLVRGWSPCGPDHTVEEGPFASEHVLIGLAYALVPTVVLVLAGRSVRAASVSAPPAA